MEEDQVRVTAGGWWLYRNMSAGERSARVELDRRESCRAREAWRAYDLVQQVTNTGGADAIRVVLALLDAAPGDQGAESVGTGPLEDLINDHGDALVDVVEQSARQSPEFARALGCVVVEQGRLRPGTLERLGRWLPVR